MGRAGVTQMDVGIYQAGEFFHPGSSSPSLQPSPIAGEGEHWNKKREPLKATL